MCHKCSSYEHFEKVKLYIKKYFIKLHDTPTILMYIPKGLDGDLKFITMSHEEAKKQFFLKTLVCKVNANDNSIQKWFFDIDCERYTHTMDPNKERVFIKDQTKYVNMFHGFKFTDRDQYLDKMKDPKLSKRAKEGKHFLWNHIKEVLCSNIEEEFKYLKGHTAKVIS
eukprot:gene9248-11329_t